MAYAMVIAAVEILVAGVFLAGFLGFVPWMVAGGFLLIAVILVAFAVSTIGWAKREIHLDF